VVPLYSDELTTLATSGPLSSGELRNSGSILV
jgi:hypothetical protein